MADVSTRSAEGIFRAPGGGDIPVTYSFAAPDHVVVYDYWRGFGPKGGDRVTVWRHGKLARQEQEFLASKRKSDPDRAIAYANFATGSSANGIIGSVGEPSQFAFYRKTERNADRYRYRLTRTSETRVIGGESCAVWHARPVGEPNGVFTGVERRACIACDGVVLYDAWLYRSGEVAEERKAIKVVRRPVRQAEVLPPADALNWAGWLRRAQVNSDSPPRGSARNHDLELRTVPRSAEPGEADRQRMRASGGWESSEKWAGDQRLNFSLRHDAAGLRMSSTDEMVGIYYTPGRKAQAPFQAEDLGKTGRVLGEECRWTNPTVGISDYSALTCITADGLPLRIEETSWGSQRPAWTAVSLTRGKTPVSAMRPPRLSLDAATWGWPEMSRAQPSSQ